MNSLEFIEKEINTYKQIKEQAILKIPDEDDEIQLYLLQKRIDFINERLPILEQIKSELEAWEIAKSKEVDLYDVIHTTNYKQYKSENENLLKQYFLNQQEFETLKKALDVEE